MRVGQATLTIFEGLRLSRITVWAGDVKSPDAVLLIADDFNIEYDPAALLRGRLAATRIIATSPKVHLVENVDNESWNYQRLSGSNHRTKTQSGEVLPEIVLRDAEIQYSEIHNGRFSLRGTMAIEGRLTPSPDSTRYTFTMQSRGNVEGVGPVVSGELHLGSGEVEATLSHFRFGRDIEAMLPTPVRDWWIAHQLEGSLDIPSFKYVPPVRGQPPLSPASKLNYSTFALPFRPSSNPVRQSRFRRLSLRTSTAPTFSTIMASPSPVSVADSLTTRSLSPVESKATLQILPLISNWTPCPASRFACRRS